MYFPYVRGRQYELLALRELIGNNILNEFVIPIIEPVKLSPTLIKTMDEYIKANHPISVIRNPIVGSFLKDLNDAEDCSKEAIYRDKFFEQYDSSMIIKSVIMQSNIYDLLKDWDEKGINKSDLLVINTSREYLDIYGQLFNSTTPRFALIPDESRFRRKVGSCKVLLDDKFKRQNRNVDYQKQKDEFFSDDHIYYKEDGFVGFSDYSVVGNEYLEAGFAPYAVVIHIVYFASDMNLRVKHFVSKSNDDIVNPALKFYEAVTELANWYNTNENTVKLTLGLETFLKHYNEQTYPGLGTVKKLSLMHHIELMGKYLSEVN